MAKRGPLQRARESNKFKARTQGKREAIVGKQRAAQQNRADFMAPTVEARGRLAVQRVGEYRRTTSAKLNNKGNRLGNNVRK